MKKITLITAFVAALSLVSCKKENQNAPVTMEHVTFQAQETKAVFDTPSGTDYPTLWTANDTQVAISYNYTGGNSPVSVPLTPASGGQSATFTADFPTGLESYEFIAVSPAAVVKSWNSTNKTANIEIAAGQTSTADSPDEAAMILYAREAGYTTLPKNVDMTFHHFTGYLHLVFTNYETALSSAGATVQSVSITSAKDLVGRFFFKPEDSSVTVNAAGKTLSVVTSSLASVWAALVPVDLSNETLTFVVSTDKGTMTKDVALPASRNLTSGKIAKVTVDMTGIALTAPVQYNLVTDASQLHVGDKILIAAANLDVAMSTTQNTNNRGATSVTKGTDVILDPSSAVEILTLDVGAVPGEYALKTSGNQYLYAAGGNSSNWLKSAAPSEVNETTAPLGSWDIRILNGQDNGTGEDVHEQAEGTTDNVAWIEAKAVDRGKMFYNGITQRNSNSLFSCYASIAYYTSYLRIYRLDEPATDHFKPVMPRANGEGKVTVAAAGEALKVNVFSSVAWTATGTAAAAFLDKTSGTGNDVLTLTLPANTGSTELSYQLVISTTASVTPNSYTFNITQLAPISGGASVNDVLWEEWWTGGVKDQEPSDYYASSTKTTTVYGGGTVTYSQYSPSTSKTQLKDDGVVYYNSSANVPADSDYKYNLLVRPKNGYFDVAGIPCPGVKKATLTYRSNYGTNNNLVESATTGVTLGTLSAAEFGRLDDSSKKSQTLTCTVSIDSGVSTLNLRFINKNSGSTNVRMDGFELVVTEVW